MHVTNDNDISDENLDNKINLIEKDIQNKETLNKEDGIIIHRIYSGTKIDESDICEAKQESEEHKENWSFNNQSKNYEDSRNVFTSKYQNTKQDSDRNIKIYNNELIFEG